MNEEKRIRITKAAYLARVVEQLVNDILEETNESLDSMPENLHISTKGIELIDDISALETASSLIYDATDFLGLFDEPKSLKGKKEILKWNVKLDELINEIVLTKKIVSDQSENISKQDHIKNALLALKEIEKELKKLEF